MADDATELERLRSENEELKNKLAQGVVDHRRKLMELEHRLDSEFPPDYRYDNNDISKIKNDRDHLRTMRMWLQGCVKDGLGKLDG